VDRWEDVVMEALSPPLRIPRHPLLMARFGMSGLRSALGLLRARFTDDRACAFFAGIAAHTLLPLDRSPSAAFGMMLALAGHAAGWPFARGGSQRIAEALCSVLRAHGGSVETGVPVTSLDELDDAAAVLLDLTPRQVLGIAGDAFPQSYARQLRRFRHAPGVFKVDWALSQPIPWTAPECGRAGTIHIGPSTAAIAASAQAAWYGRRDEYPYIILAQPTLFDSSRAPADRHTAWAYCHVPHGSTLDMTPAIEGQVERFAPGFRETILARSALSPAALELHNANLIGGDINGGVHDMRQFLFRPVASRDPYRTPLERVFLCSASTPPGAAVHGMCGYHAARSALRRIAS
jgi:phytoene dehydrogenase-like protein